MKERFKVVPAVYVFLKKDGGILLTRRFNTGYKDGEYMVPSGHVEEGESLRAAIVRETMEEVGVSVRPEDLRMAHMMYRAPSDATGTRADFFFDAASWEGEPRNCEPHEARPRPKGRGIRAGFDGEVSAPPTLKYFASFIPRSDSSRRVFRRHSDKCDEVAWFPLDHLPKNTVGYLVEAISAAKSGIPLLEYGWGLETV